MSASRVDTDDLLDLKLMPAWVKEPSARGEYAHYEGEEPSERPSRHPRGRRPQGREKRPPAEQRGNRDKRRPRDRDGKRGPGDFRRTEERAPKPEPPLEVAVQFLPRSTVMENVVAQVKAEAFAYSLFFLARSFLEKPQRYDVSLKTKPETPLQQIGETGAVSADRAFLESNAFRLASEQFYRVEVTQSEPLKGNFTSVARCRLSGSVLGPTNHHDYQRRLRSLYEQRFSRRMNFAEYQRQIEIVSDPAAVEQWKEEARSQTTFFTLDEQTPLTFPNAGEAERHFRLHHLSGLIRSVAEVVIDGVSSRQLGDRRLRRHIEEAWTIENRSPSHMLQELAKRFRDAGLHIFRHRRGMLFVSSIRVRPFLHDEQSVSPQVRAILELVAGSPRIRRKEVGDKLLAEVGAELETRRLALASDLRWLISEGYLIEFNDGALDLPRAKTKKAEDPAAEAALAEGEIPSTPDTAAEESPPSAAPDIADQEKPPEPVTPS